MHQYLKGYLHLENLEIHSFTVLYKFNNPLYEFGSMAKQAQTEELVHTLNKIMEHTNNLIYLLKKHFVFISRDCR